MKTCSMCAVSLPLTAFHRMALAKDKLQPKCKACNCATVAAWAKANPGRRNARSARRNARKLRATVGWSETDKIAEVYVMAERIGGAHVDHFLPLKGLRVCGLHVLANLRILDAIENIAKGNSFDQENHVHVLPASAKIPPYRDPNAVPSEAEKHAIYMALRRTLL